MLAAFDGREWKALTPTFPRALLPRAELRVRGQPIRYQATLEPLKIASVPLLEAALEAPLIDGRRVQARDDLQWVADRPLAERTRFTAQAYIDFRHGPTSGLVGLQDYVDLPPGYTRAPSNGQPRCAASRATPRPTAARWHRRCWPPSAAAASATRWHRAPTAKAIRAAPSTNSGWTADKASASTSPPPSWS